MSGFRVCGLDPSFTRTGLARQDGTTISLTPRPGRMEPDQQGPMPEWVSVLAKANQIRDWAWPHLAGSDLIVMEKPPVVLPAPKLDRGQVHLSQQQWNQLQSRLSSLLVLVELQTVLKQRLRVEARWDGVLLLYPASIQGFARNGAEHRSFKGLAPAQKKAAMEDLARENGWAGPHAGGSNDDEAEAWWMRAVGMHVLGDPVVEPSKYRDRKAREWSAQLAPYRRSVA